jgi:hypothetical protein
MFKFIIKTFDQVKNDNFDQVKFDQPTPCLLNLIEFFRSQKQHFKNNELKSPNNYQIFVKTNENFYN